MNTKLFVSDLSPYYKILKKDVTSNINSIYIDVDVETTAGISSDNIYLNVLTHKQDDIRVFISENDTFENINFLVTHSNNELFVKVSLKSTNSDTPISINLLLPKKIFTMLSILSKISTVFIDNFVCAKKINIEGDYCDLSVFATFESLYINTFDGSIKVESKLNTNASLDISSANANIDVKIRNIRLSRVLVFSFPSANFKNSPVLGGKYSISGCVSSKKGFVKFY